VRCRPGVRVEYLREAAASGRIVIRAELGSSIS